MRNERAVRTVTRVAVGVHVAAAVVVVVLGAASEPLAVDPWRPLPLAIVLALPAVLAGLALRGRAPLLLAGGAAGLVLAVFPLSAHSLVVGPASVVYLVAYGRLSSDASRRAVLAAAACPVLAIGALLVLGARDHPVCYQTLESGEVRVDRAPGDDARSSGTATIGADSDVVAAGCAGDTAVWWEAAASLGLSAAGLAAAMTLVPAARKPERALR